MRWTLLSLQLQGFTSFKEKQTLIFSDIPSSAFVFVSGVNEVEPELEGNGSGKCLSGDTKISLLDGTETPIRELIGRKLFWVYSYDHKLNRIVPAKAIARKTKRNARLVLVQLDNGEKVKCTPDHLWMLRDGTYKKAEDLILGQALMPLYRKFGYTKVFQPNSQKYENEHYCFANGERKPEKGITSHHINFNSKDNSPPNLRWMSLQNHTALHTHLFNSMSNPVTAKKVSDKLTGRPISDVTKRKMSKSRKHGIKEGSIRTWNKGLTTKMDLRVKPSWCKGLTKKTDSRVKLVGQKVRAAFAAKRKKKQLLNHKVVSVIKIAKREDCYDLQVEQYHNFALSAGVFVHNSALFGALEYALFGRTSAVKATHLKSWSSKNRLLVTCSIKDSENNKYVITRTREPNSLVISKNGEPAVTIEQLALEELLGYDLDSFEYAVMVPQFSKKFFDLDPAQKMQLFDSIMEKELSIWMQKSDEAKDKANILDEDLIKHRADMQYIKGQLDAVRPDLEPLLKEWEQGRQKRVAEETTRLDELNLSVKDLEENITKERKELEYSQAIINKKEKELSKEDKLIETIRKINEEHKIKIAGQQTELDMVQNQLKQMLGIVGKCPLCHSKVDAKHLKMEAEKLNNNVYILEDGISQYELHITENTKKGRIQKDICNNLEKELQTLRDDQDSLQFGIKGNLQLVSRAKEDIKESTASLIEIKKEINPYTAQVKQAERQKIGLQRQFERAEKVIKDKEESCELIKYWIRGFKEIRLMKVGEAIIDLEMSINDYIQQFGLGDGWEVKLEMDRETQKKTIQKGFNVFVKSPENSELVPFECWSGGEGQRLRLAGTLALMDFIHDRRGKDWSIEIWDEPTQWLSESGISDLLDTLKERSKETSRQIFLIDHRDFHTFGDFDMEIVVRKGKQGSRLEIKK